MIIEIILTIFCSLALSYLFFKAYVILMKKRIEKRMLGMIKEQKEKGFKFIVPKMDANGKDVGEEIDLLELYDRQINPTNLNMMNKNILIKKVISQNIDEDDI